MSNQSDNQPDIISIMNEFSAKMVAISAKIADFSAKMRSAIKNNTDSDANDGLDTNDGLDGLDGLEVSDVSYAKKDPNEDEGITTESETNSEYLKSIKKVFIQKLNRKKQPELSEYYRERWYNLVHARSVYFYTDTGSSNQIKSGRKYGNSFIGTFITAYNYHGDILLNPDDMWLMVSLYFSKYVDSNAEALRTKFVKHEGKKKLVIVDSDTENDCLKKWDHFFPQIIAQIKEHTLPNVVDELVCNFSTTTPAHTLISSAVIMNSFKQYFSYGRMYCGCGIGNVYFEGVRDDWVKLIEKLDNLKKYDVDKRLIYYVDKMNYIFTNFLKTYDGERNEYFWNNIMSTNERRVGSGSDIQTHILGWILHFYGIYGYVDLSDVPSYSIEVPIDFTNCDTGDTKELKLTGDWILTSKLDEYTYQPTFGLCIN